MFVFIYVSLVGLLPSNELFYLNNQGRLYLEKETQENKSPSTSASLEPDY